MQDCIITLSIRETGALDARGFLFHVLVDGQSIANNQSLTPEQAQQVHQLSQQFNEQFEGRYLSEVANENLISIGTDLFKLWLAAAWGRVAPAIPAGATRTLVIASDMADVLNLPWELMRLPDGNFIGFDQKFAVRRLPRAETALRKFEGQLRARPLRVLFVACSPMDQDPLDFENEEKILREALARVRTQIAFESGDMGSYEELRDLLNEFQPHVVHLTGHGVVKQDEVGYFCFENERGTTDDRSSYEMRDLFAASGVQCVFVSGCQTAKAPPVAALGGICQGLVSDEVPFAIGWAASIADDVATEFASTFYSTLAAGQPINRAMSQARLAIRKTCEQFGYPAWTLPALYAATDQTLVFDLRAAADPPPRRNVVQQPLGGIGYAEHFVGRRRQIQELLPKLRDGELSTVVLTGLGGTGKSALATRLARGLETDGFTPIAIASSASVPINADTLLGRCRQAFLDAGLRDSYNLLFDRSIEVTDRLHHIVTVFNSNNNQKRFLLLLDNFETNLDEQTCRIISPEVAEFYHYLMTNLTGDAWTGSRAIITSRYLPIDVSSLPPQAQHLPLEDLAERDFFKFLMRDKEVERRYQNGLLSQELLSKLYRLFGGTPRFLGQIREALRQMDSDKLKKELEQVELPTGAEPGKLQQARNQYCEEVFTARLFGYLSSEAQRALCRAAVFNIPVNFEGLAAVAGVTAEQARRFTTEWQERALAFPDRQRSAQELWTAYGLLRTWLLAPERISAEDLKAANKAAGEFLREMEKQRRAAELGLSREECLLEARAHFLNSGDYKQARLTTDEVCQAYNLRGSYAAITSLNREMLDHEEHPDSVSWVGSSHLDTGNYAEARKCYRHALEMYPPIGDRAGEAEAWHGLATIDLNEGNYPAAREKFNRSLEITQQTGDREIEAHTRTQLASIDLEEGNYPAAREKLNRALEIEQQFGDRKGEAATWNLLATTDWKEGNYQAAKEKFNRALEISRQIGYRVGEATIMAQFAQGYMEFGNYPAAREKLNRALEITQQIGDRVHEVDTWHQLALADLKEGNSPAAREKFNRALEITQQIGDRKGEAANWHQLATTDWKEGNSPAAREKFNRALEIAKQAGLRENEAHIWNGLALVDCVEGNFLAAREKFNRALEMEQQIGDRAGEATTLFNLASVDLKEGNSPAAREKFDRALEMKQQIGDRAGEATTLFNLASVDLKEGNSPAAREKLQRSLELEQQISDREGEALSFLQMGGIAIRQGRLPAATRLIALSYSIFKAIGHGDAPQVGELLEKAVKRLNYTPEQVQAMLAEVAQTYTQDRGAGLLRAAFGEE